MINITNTITRRKHDDKGKDRKFGPQKDAIREFVQMR